MKKLVKFRLGLCAIELVFSITLLYMESGIYRKYQYAGIVEVVSGGGFCIILTARLICALLLEILPNDIDLVWTRTGMVLFMSSGWVQVWERIDLDRAGVAFGVAFIFLFDQTVFFLNHPIPPEYLHTVQRRPEQSNCEDEKTSLRSVQVELEEKGNCVRRAVVS